MTMNKADGLPKGEMWFDKSPKTAVKDKVLAAAEHFRRKHGRWPTTVWANPKTLENFVNPDGLKVVATGKILPDHFLVGPLP